MGARVTNVLLGGAPRILFYRTQDVMLAEGQMGKSLRAALAESSIRDLVTLLWAGLKHQDAQLTPDRVATWLDEAKKGERTVMAFWNTIGEGLYDSGFIPRVASTEVPAADPTGVSSPPGEPSP